MGMYHTKHEKAGFCTVSQSKRQDAAAIWTHMNQTLKDIRTTFPTVVTIHFWSDGPSKQYKNKNNFLLICAVSPQLGFKNATWNFFPTSHGKGAPDGIGAMIQRCADNIVLRGQNIVDGKDFYEKVSSSLSGIKLQLFTSDGFQFYDNLVMHPLKSITGTRKVHQVIAEGNVIHCRHMSCFCNEPHICLCFSPVTHAWDCIPQDSDVTTVQSPLAILMEAMEKEPSGGPEGTATGIDPGDIQSEDWLVVMYDQYLWLVKALAVDLEHHDVQV